MRVQPDRKRQRALPGVRRDAQCVTARQRASTMKPANPWTYTIVGGALGLGVGTVPSIHEWLSGPPGRPLFVDTMVALVPIGMGIGYCVADRKNRRLAERRAPRRDWQGANRRCLECG